MIGFRAVAPLRTAYRFIVWAIRVRLEIANEVRDLAIFNLAIDSKLRGCDLVKLKVVDVFSGGQVKERASITQCKTRHPVRFEITEETRKSIAAWLEDPAMIRTEYLWPGRFHERLHISTYGTQPALIMPSTVSVFFFSPRALDP